MEFEIACCLALFVGFAGFIWGLHAGRKEGYRSALDDVKPQYLAGFGWQNAFGPLKSETEYRGSY